MKDQSHKAACVPLRASLGNGLNYIFNDILLVFAAIQALVQGFGPDDAMDQLLRFLSDCAHRKALLLVLIRTLVALSFTLKDGRHWGTVSFGSCFNKWNPQVKAHPVNMIPSLNIV